MDAPDVAAHLERAFQGEQDLNLAVRLAGRASTEPPLVMRVRVVTGSAGQWAIVEFHREAGPRPSVRLDPLTGLADRAAIAQHIESWRLDAAPRGTPFAVLFLDLDRFKRVNDEHGHAVGDAVLQAVAARWLKCVREDDLVARYGGDEFVILLKGVSATDEVDPVVRRLTTATLEPVTFGGQRHQVAVTIGVAFATSGEPAVEALVAAADRDMYSRKRASRP
jgi:diguanylate cyclase (GGDEF)-like protein